MSDFGKKGGSSPTKNKRASVYEIAMPDGTVFRKESFKVHDAEAVATGFKNGGKTLMCVWPGEPPWEGDFGRLVAKRVEQGARLVDGEWQPMETKR